MSKPTILVTAATGTVGALLTEQLVKQGYPVRAGTRKPDVYRVEGAHPVPLDLAVPDTYSKALEEVNRVFLLSPTGVTKDYELVSPFLRTVLAKTEVDRVVLMTAQGVEHLADHSLRRLELELEGSGKPYAILRPSWFSQNFHTYWGHGIRHQNMLSVPAEDAQVSFIDARDIAASAFGVLTADKAPNAGFTLTGPKALTHQEAATILSRAVGHTIRYASIDDETFRSHLRQAGLPDEYSEMMVELFAAVRAGGAREVTDSVAQLAGRPALALSDYAETYAAQLRPESIQ